ncbi:MAG: methylmalonyl Co-A mutase-associated GTPase MeaB [Gemmatimonadaceae bacterium]
MPRSFERLLTDFDAGKPAALARVVRIVGNPRVGSDALMTALHSRIGRARRLGITGPPGAGKSTITNLIVQSLRAAGSRVAVIAVDPTSPFTGGALLGDRVRMESVSLDPGVYIRSMATRGSLGGLSARTAEVADVVDAFGFDWIIIETVGVGQSELEIARTADTTVVVLVPESGDSIQTLKAGVMEIADVFVVNKADRPGADRLRNDIQLMLGLRTGGGATPDSMPAHHGVELKSFNPMKIAREAALAESPETWTPPVLSTIAAQEKGIGELLAAVERHFRYLEASGRLHERRRARLRSQVVEVVAERIRGRLWGDEATNAWVDARLAALESGSETPFSVADALLRQSGSLLTGAEA